MHTFQYKYGDRPLDGYTIQRAAGRGGFGEVYYAVSDSGRQVALKVIQNYQQIELRGIRQCMNLKSPHLVTIFDVRDNDPQQPFVIMEYVSGPSLRDLLDEAPSGLGEQKAAFFLREIAKGLSFLHECGIVHRDLKPGNIFYENGYVKIGDYGLSKAIAAAQNSGQTITVGTVHYMAPEVGAGRYDRGIDIYALGIMLYEMLTGQVPYFGASPGEVLMKHMTAQPELKDLPEPFVRVIRKALAKDPDDRYQTVQEMVEDVFGTEHIRNSVSQFSPESLSTVARRAAEKIPNPTDTATRKESPANYFDKKIETIGQCHRHIADKLHRPGGPKGVYSDTAERKLVHYDPMARRQRLFLGFMTMAAFSIGIGVIEGGRDLGLAMIVSFLMMNGVCWGILLCRWKLLANLESSSLRKLITGGVALIFAGILSFGPLTNNAYASQSKGIMLSMALLAFFDWWRLTNPIRSERIDLGNILWIGFMGWVLSQIINANAVISVGVLTGAMMATQVISAFVPKELRKLLPKDVFSSKPKPANEVSNRDSAGNPAPVPPSPPSDRVSSAYSVPNGVSPYKRVWALLMSGGLFLGICGLQRFYIGKVWTGLLWLMTWGLLGIGQIIDVLMILFGHFKDKQGRPLLIWENPDEINKSDFEQKITPALTGHIPPVEPFNIMSFIFNLIGNLLLFLALTAGLLVSLHLPALIAAGLPEPDAAREFQEFFGTPNWPALLDKFGVLIMVILLLGSLVCVLIARRQHGPVHFIRACLGFLGLLGSLLFLNESLPRSYSLNMGQLDWKAGQIIEYVFNHSKGDEFIAAVILFVISMVLLAWPAGKPQSGVALSEPHGV